MVFYIHILQANGDSTSNECMASSGKARWEGVKWFREKKKSIYFSLMIISGSCHDGQYLKSYHC